VHASFLALQLGQARRKDGGLGGGGMGSLGKGWAWPGLWGPGWLGGMGTLGMAWALGSGAHWIRLRAAL